MSFTALRRICLRLGCIAMLLVTPIEASAQVQIGLEGTIYGASTFVTARPCHAYQINWKETQSLYPDVAKQLRAFGPVQDVTVALHFEHRTPPGDIQLYDISDISPRYTGLHDARKLCTSVSPGGYYEGVLAEYSLGQNGLGLIDLVLGGQRHVLFNFTKEAPPIRAGEQVVGKTPVRVYVNNVVGPNGDTSQTPTRIETLPSQSPSPSLLGVVSKPEKVALDLAVTYLPTVLRPSGGAARVNYAGTCEGQVSRPGIVLMPRVYASPAPQGSTGITAVQQIFRNDPQVTVTQDRSGIITITVEHTSTTALRTKIPALTLDSESQYFAYFALAQIASELNRYAEQHGLHFGTAASTFDHIVGYPVAGAPHLPPSMRNVTLDEALDSVAQTFKSIVLYGTCTQPDGKELFRID